MLAGIEAAPWQVCPCLLGFALSSLSYAGKTLALHLVVHVTEKQLRWRHGITTSTFQAYLIRLFKRTDFFITFLEICLENKFPLNCNGTFVMVLHCILLDQLF